MPACRIRRYTRPCRRRRCRRVAGRRSAIYDCRVRSSDTTGALNTIRHYVWAGLDFIVDRDGAPVLIEANRSSHMLGEYLQFFGNERPFELVADVMNRNAGPPCLLWRRGDPLPDADEDACFIGRHLAKHLDRPPVVCNVEDNHEPREELVSRDRGQVRPGSIFRWWYGLHLTYERSGVTVINPNCVWVTVRDKLLCAQALAGAKHFRVPQSFAVGDSEAVRRLLDEHTVLFADGYVLKPRVGWGGQGVQVAEAADRPREINGGYMLSERIHSPRLDGRFWEARVFVMAGIYLGGIRHSSRSPLTNYWQGGVPEPLDDATAAGLEKSALEAVRLADDAAQKVHELPRPPESTLTEVYY